jgi:hypothetical protein
MSHLRTFTTRAYRNTSGKAAAFKCAIYYSRIRSFSATSLSMAPVPIVVFGRKGEIASKVREDMLPEYDGAYVSKISSHT